MTSLLVLRPQPGADRTAALARAAGFDVQLYPLFHVVPLAWEPPDPADFDALLVTSANAVRHAGPALTHFQHLPTYAVGSATAQALLPDTFTVRFTGNSDVQQVIRRIESDGHHRLLHLSGIHVRPYGDTPLQIVRRPVYASIDIGTEAALSSLLRPATILLVHSPRAAARLSHLVPPPGRATLRLVAISNAVLAAAGSGWATALAASAPTDKAMLALAATLCD